MSLKYNGKLIEYAKSLRKEMTTQEKHLWYDFLRISPVRFQRQKAIGNYIVDFYCHQAKLVIELDGSQHCEDKQHEYDNKRSRELEEMGIRVVRFTNLEIDTQFDEVCEIIASLIE